MIGVAPHARVAAEVWWIIGTTQMGKSPAMPPPIWKNPMELVAAVDWYHADSSIIYST
jgi:hypothetical protein